MLPIRQLTRTFLRSVTAQCVVTGLGLALVSSVFGAWLPCVVGLVASAVGELFLEREEPAIAGALRTMSLGMTVRMVLRLLAVFILGVVAQTPASHVQLVAALALGLLVGRAGSVLTWTRLRKRRQPRIETRNLPLDDLGVAPAPPTLITRFAGSAICLFELFLSVPVSVPGTRMSLLVALGAVGVGGAFVLTGYLEVGARRTGSLVSSSDLVPLVQAAIDRVEPRVLLYSGDSRSSAYQVNMWLETLEDLALPAAVVLRNRSMIGGLKATRLPIVCVPNAVDMLALDWSSVDVSLFTASIGNNIHMLREPGVKSVFIGHGDSDKAASFNPYSKAYDQVWVAGPAGRQRYAAAGVGVRDEDVVEVGRPQLEQFKRVSTMGSVALPTVLYAPTWEGWATDQAHSSVAVHGLALALAALAPGSGVRFVYKPHPYLGRRDQEIGDAHRGLLRMVQEANEQADLAVPPFEPPTVEGVEPLPRDRVDAMVVSGRNVTRALSAGEMARRRDEAEAAFWGSLPPAAHVVVPPSGPSLLSCFGQADLLVTDVSSVVTDFQVTGQPYAVCNMTGLSSEDFLKLVPSAAAGAVLDPDGGGIADVLRLARGEVPDERADERRELRRYLLGDDDVPAVERLRQALVALSDAP